MESTLPMSTPRSLTLASIFITRPARGDSTVSGTVFVKRPWNSPVQTTTTAASTATLSRPISGRAAAPTNRPVDLGLRRSLAALVTAGHHAAGRGALAEPWVCRARQWCRPAPAGRTATIFQAPRGCAQRCTRNGGTPTGSAREGTSRPTRDRLTVSRPATLAALISPLSSSTNGSCAAESSLG